ncbi:MAG: T9SS-dependent M36 family metallopeptidase [Crocinitomicaceae bacterium]|nr:T9SS-dependent M36 family metallopeptidase [Crocinitomicaceae bacterium]
MRTHYQFLGTIVFCCLTFFGYGQSTEQSIKDYFEKNRTDLGLTAEDITNFVIYDEHQSNTNELLYTYIQQQYEGIPLYNAVATFVSKDGRILLTGNNLEEHISDRIQGTAPALSALEAIGHAARQLELNTSGQVTLLSDTDDGVFSYRSEDLSKTEIPVKLMYFPSESGDIKLVWNLSIHVLNGNDWWSVRIDAITGELIDKVNWMLSCNFGEGSNHNHATCTSEAQQNVAMPSPPPGTDQYNVFAIPVESPSHGGRTLVVGPSDAVASPFGWHDDNGAAGAEYTITRGNNVFATEDQNGNDGVGYAPDGTAAINFDFPLNLNQAPALYEDVAITNLFYMNNIMHDVWYQYGFDEASGNFQENNYGNGGIGTDYVIADAQDGSGMNNANFGTPGDGGNPQMQMYLWSDGPPNLLTVNTPAIIAGDYAAVEAGFGAAVPVTPITSDFVLFDDNAGVDPNDACEPAVNGSSISGNIAVIYRGDCEFGVKVLAAQNQGALAVIMINNVATAPIVMGGGASGGSVTIPSVMISDVDGAAIIAEMMAGTVNGTLAASTTYELDGDLDNGIVAHEYGHGISNRLTGGASNSNCLSNDEQMGEGWSDWFGLMLTIEPGDVSTDIRGIGTYATGEPVTGYGIRPAPYTTDLAINNFTYAATNNTGAISQPHGIGFVWCTMLWEMTWDLIDQYGFDPDVYNGIGGNNIAMHLVVTGLKLQPCDPGFEDGRDAILQADQLLYGGIHQCLIWNAFAERGLGHSADQGSANSRTDQTEAFDLPPGFVNSAGSASVSSCDDYFWTESGMTYTSSGSYVAVLQNVNGCDSTATLNLTINQSSSFTETVAVCNSYTWSVDGGTYTSSGNYLATIPNAAGCDSIITLDLTINTDQASTDIVVSCAAYSWSADGNTYSTTGMYTTVLTSSTGCDSTVTLDLTMSTTAATSETLSACDTYFWPATGSSYTSSGNYATTLTSSTGCDSTVTLFLTINSANSSSETAANCGSYTWPVNGQTYTASGNYSSLLNTSTGCDSTLNLDLTIYPSYSTIDNVSACESYVWPVNGQTYTTSGNYPELLASANGCDSTVTLELVINPIHVSSETISACESYTWAVNGQTYTSGGSFTENLSTSTGCDSTLTLDLTIDFVDVSITNVDPITLSAVQSNANYQWIDCSDNSIISGATSQTYSPTTNGDYAVIVTMNSCEDTSVCRTVSELGIIENGFGTDLVVYPNPTFGNIHVDLGSEFEVINVELFSMNGQLIEQKQVLMESSFDLELKGSPGSYMLKISTASGVEALIKILKE